MMIDVAHAMTEPDSYILRPDSLMLKALMEDRPHWIYQEGDYYHFSPTSRTSLSKVQSAMEMMIENRFFMLMNEAYKNKVDVDAQFGNLRRQARMDVLDPIRGQGQELLQLHDLIRAELVKCSDSEPTSKLHIAERTQKS